MIIRGKGAGPITKILLVTMADNVQFEKIGPTATIPIQSRKGTVQYLPLLEITQTEANQNTQSKNKKDKTRTAIVGSSSEALQQEIDIILLQETKMKKEEEPGQSGQSITTRKNRKKERQTTRRRTRPSQSPTGKCCRKRGDPKWPTTFFKHPSHRIITAAIQLQTNEPKPHAEFMRNLNQSYNSRRFQCHN